MRVLWVSCIVLVSCGGSSSDATSSTGPAAGAAGSGSAAATLDGKWKVTAIACDGKPGNGFVQNFITPPNASEFSVAGATSTYTLTYGSCELRLDSTVAYPMQGRAVFDATGPWTCTPEKCNQGCDHMPAIPYVFDWHRDGSTLTMTSVGDTEDQTCTGTGEMNPITYTYAME